MKGFDAAESGDGRVCASGGVGVMRAEDVAARGIERWAGWKRGRSLDPLARFERRGVVVVLWDGGWLRKVAIAMLVPVEHGVFVWLTASPPFAIAPYGTLPERGRVRQIRGSEGDLCTFYIVDLPRTDPIRRSFPSLPPFP